MSLPWSRVQSLVEVWPTTTKKERINKHSRNTRQKNPGSQNEFLRVDQRKEEGTNNSRDEIWDIIKDTKAWLARLLPSPVSFLSILPTNSVYIRRGSNVML